MFVYFYNSFQSLGIPVYLGESVCLPLTHLGRKCSRVQEGGRGPLGCGRPRLRGSGLHCPCRGHGSATSGAQAPAPPPGAFCSVRSREASSPSALVLPETGGTLRR